MFLAPNIKVRVKNNPSRIGITTAARRKIGPIEYVQVDFGTTKRYYPESHLEIVQEYENPDVLFKRGAFGALDSLRMVLILEKLRRQITNMFYSMNVSSADFLPYQFKPVLKFIESVSGRMLIADEVGSCHNSIFNHDADLHVDSTLIGRFIRRSSWITP